MKKFALLGAVAALATAGGVFAAFVFTEDKGSKHKLSASELYTASAVSHINKCGYTLFIISEADEGITPCFYTEAKAFFLIRRDKIPWHPSVIFRNRQKLQITVASLPCITEYE